MQQGQWNPQHRQGKGANHTAKSICKNHALVGGGSFGRTGQLLVEHLVQAIQHRADANDRVAECTVLCLVRGRGLVAASPAARLGAVLGGRGVTVGHDEDADNGNGHGDNLAQTDLFAQDGDAEGIGEEGGAVVDGRQVRGGGLIDSNVPAAAGQREGTGDGGRHSQHVADGGDEGLARGRVQGLVLHHEGRLAQQLDVAAPESGPGGGPALQAQQGEHGGPQQHPRAVRHVQHAVGLVPLELVLDVYGRLCLHREADEAQRQQESGIRVAPPRLKLRLRLWIALVQGVEAAGEAGGALDALVLVLVMAEQWRAVAAMVLRGAQVGRHAGGGGGGGGVVVFVFIPVVEAGVRDVGAVGRGGCRVRGRMASCSCSAQGYRLRHIRQPFGRQVTSEIALGVYGVCTAIRPCNEPCRRSAAMHPPSNGLSPNLRLRLLHITSSATPLGLVYTPDTQQTPLHA